MNLLTLFVCINIPMGMLTVAGTPFYVNGTDNCFFPSSGAPGADPTTSIPDILIGGVDAASFAKGNATLTSAVAGNTLTVNGLVYTGVVGVKANSTQFSVDTSDTAAATDLADSIATDVRVGITVPALDVTATSSVGIVIITSTIQDASANNIDLSENTSGTTIVVTGAFLTGGSDGIVVIGSTLDELRNPTNSTATDPGFGDGGVLNNFFDTVDQAAKAMEVLKHVISGDYIINTIDHFVLDCSYNATGHLVTGVEHPVWTGLKEGINVLITLLMIFTLFYWATGRGHILTS